MKYSIKRLLLILLAVAMALTFAACGGQPEEPEEIEEPADPTVLRIKRGTKEIEPHAYEGNAEIKTVVIPDSVTAIGEAAFKNCVNLETVEFPDSLTSIGAEAFQSCEKLQSVALPPSLTSIGAHAFYWCAGLTTVTIPASVAIDPDGLESDAQAGVFCSCKNLTSVTLEPGLKEIGPEWFDDCNSLTQIEIPDSVIRIHKHAFFGTHLESVVIPDSVTQIDAGAFSCCRELTAVTVPDSVTDIGEAAFKMCGRLTSFDLPDGLTAIRKNTFEECSSLESIELPDSVVSIEGGAFKGCVRLAEVRMPGAIESIDYRAFENCAALESIELPGTLTKFNGSAVEGTGLLKNYEEIFGGESEATWSAIKDPEDVRNVEGALPELSGKRVFPIDLDTRHQYALDEIMFLQMPADIRWPGTNGADYALIRGSTLRLRDDYIGIAYDRTTTVVLYALDGSHKAMLLYNGTSSPPFQGEGILTGESPSEAYLWATISHFFGK